MAKEPREFTYRFQELLLCTSPSSLISSISRHLSSSKLCSPPSNITFNPELHKALIVPFEREAGDSGTVSGLLIKKCLISREKSAAPFLPLRSMWATQLPVSDVPLAKFLCTHKASKSKNSTRYQWGGKGGLDLIPWIYLSLPLYNHKGFDLGHTWMV